jgi:rhodanese-related sulfurtransferase
VSAEPHGGGEAVKFGYANVRAYEGGLEEWKAAGLTVEKA